MRLDEAKTTALGMANRFGKAFSVFRMPAWADGVWLVKPADELPPKADVDTTYEPAAGVTAKKDEPNGPSQGGLF